MKKLNFVAAKTRYLENLSLLGLHEGDNPYILSAQQFHVCSSHASLFEVLAAYASHIR